MVVCGCAAIDNRSAALAPAGAVGGGPVTRSRLVALVRLVAVGCLLVQGMFVVEGASAQCADPRGNAYCPKGGLVNIPNPNPPTNVNVQNPNPPTNVNVQNPSPPTNVNVQ